ncbi:MAG: hypothetical protein ACPG4T_14965 [Nannocystaceae bacterium]
MALNTYSKYHVSCSWAPVGFPPITFTGWIPEGDAATAAFDTEQRITVKSAHGISSASVTSDETATATVNVQGEAIEAKILRALASSQYETIKAAGEIPSGPFIMADLSGGRTLTTIADACLTNAPGVTLGDSTAPVAFTFSGTGKIDAIPG